MMLTAPLALCAEKIHFVTDQAQKVNDWPKQRPLTGVEKTPVLDIMETNGLF